MQQRPGVAEEEIIRHCKTGSLKYQEMLYKLFYGYAMGVSLRYCFSREDAVEVVNDAFIKVFNAINSYANDKPFLKYPLNGLGEQQIRFGAGGLNLKFDFKSSKK
jgi:RNA polymerase sigma-70 factor (ECF subfamily)